MVRFVVGAHAGVGGGETAREDLDLIVCAVRFWKWKIEGSGECVEGEGGKGMGTDLEDGGDALEMFISSSHDEKLSTEVHVDLHPVHR